MRGGGRGGPGGGFRGRGRGDYGRGDSRGGGFRGRGGMDRGGSRGGAGGFSRGGGPPRGGMGRGGGGLGFGDRGRGMDRGRGGPIKRGGPPGAGGPPKRPRYDAPQAPAANGYASQTVSQGYGGSGNGYSGQSQQQVPVASYGASAGYGPPQGGYQQAYQGYESYAAPSDYSQQTVNSEPFNCVIIQKFFFLASLDLLFCYT